VSIWSAGEKNAPSALFRAATAALAVGIFISDTATHEDIEVAVLYVAIVLMSARFLRTRGLMVVAAGCIGLTMISALLTPAPISTLTDVANTLITISAIIVTAFLVLQGQSADMRLQEERERLRHMEEDLAHVNRVSTLGELAASLSHELKQPITAAITNANTCLRWLKRDQPDIEEASAAATRIVQDGNRAADIMDRLRSFYTKDTPVARALVDVNDLIREMLILLRSEANRYAIPMRTDLGFKLSRVSADRVQLQQVLMNLMLNGIEAMRDTGGELIVRSGPRDKGQLLVSVSDTGVGLPADKADHIFNAFFTTKSQGSGMGLAISRSIVESHGGTLWAASNPGRGATFHFTLPAAADSDPG